MLNLESNVRNGSIQERLITLTPEKRKIYDAQLATSLKNPIFLAINEIDTGLLFSGSSHLEEVQEIVYFSLFGNPSSFYQ